ncbi:MAG: CHASE2 domain-containing protein, partial [Pseudomonadota bacterium]
AELVAAADAAGAKGVILAEPVDAPDPLSPEVIGAFWLDGVRDSTLARQLDLLPSTDATLAAALAKTNGAAAIASAVRRRTAAAGGYERADAQRVRWLTVAGDGGDYVSLPKATQRFPVNAALAANTGLAVIGLAPDGDGVVRRITPLWSVDGVPAPAVAVEAARLASLGGDQNGAVVISADESAVNAAGRPLQAVTVGAARQPVADGASLRYYGPRRLDVASTPALRLLDGRGTNSQLREKVILIGLDRELTETIPFARGRFSPAEAHALIADQFHFGRLVKRPGWLGYLEAISVMALGAGAIMWAQRNDFWRALGLATLAASLLFLVSFLMFSWNTLLFNPLPGALALVLGAFSVAGGRSLGVVLRDDNVRGAFQGALPEPAMKIIREDGASAILNGARRPVTVLACELRLLDEDLEKLSAHPDDVANMMAAASNSLRNAIIETGGAADQADGGKIYAYFNAPLENADHIDAACSSAMRLVESMDKTNAELEASTRTRGVQIHLAIGIATGDCFVGPMGHGRHNRYSALGPALDMAAFLRKQAEFYGPAIICDEAVYRHTHHHFAYLELDRLRINNADAPTSIYALVGNPFIKSSKGYRQLEETHRALLAAYRSGDWLTARSKLNEAKKSPGAAIALFDIYEERLATMADADAPENWDGALEVSV